MERDPVEICKVLNSVTTYRHLGFGIEEQGGVRKEGGGWGADLSCTHVVPRKNMGDAPCSRLEGIQNESAQSWEDKGLNPPPSPLD